MTLWVTTGLCGAWAALELAQGAGGGAAVSDLLEQSWPQIVYLGVVTTAICNWIQTIGQREVPAEKVRGMMRRGSLTFRALLEELFVVQETFALKRVTV